MGKDLQELEEEVLADPDNMEKQEKLAEAILEEEDVGDDYEEMDIDELIKLEDKL